MQLQRVSNAVAANRKYCKCRKGIHLVAWRWFQWLVSWQICLAPKGKKKQKKAPPLLTAPFAPLARVATRGFAVKQKLRKISCFCSSNDFSELSAPFSTPKKAEHFYKTRSQLHRWELSLHVKFLRVCCIRGILELLDSNSQSYLTGILFSNTRCTRLWMIQFVWQFLMNIDAENSFKI